MFFSFVIGEMLGSICSDGLNVSPVLPLRAYIVLLKSLTNEIMKEVEPLYFETYSKLCIAQV